MLSEWGKEKQKREKTPSKERKGVALGRNKLNEKKKK